MYGELALLLHMHTIFYDSTSFGKSLWISTKSCISASWLWSTLVEAFVCIMKLNEPLDPGGQAVQLSIGNSPG